VRSPGEDEVAAHLVNLAWTASAISCTNLRCGSAPSRRTPFVVLFLRTAFHPVAGSGKPQSCTHSDVTACIASRTVRQLACRRAERGRGAVTRGSPSRYSGWRGWSPAHEPATPTGSTCGLT
jgi:hypothetical protein